MFLVDTMDFTLAISLLVVLPILALLLGALIVFLIYHFSPKLKDKKAKKEIEIMMRNAEIKAEQIQKNAKIDAKVYQQEARQQVDQEIKERKAGVIEQEKKLEARETQINKRDEILTQKENILEEKKSYYEQKAKHMEVKETELQQKIDSIIVELEKVAKFTQKQAHDEIIRRVEEKTTKEIALYVQQKEDEAELQLETRAKELLGLAIDKYAQDVVTERTTNTIDIPSDEMKGRIIGREGRNIRALETSTGVDIIIDDTPEAITLSSFDPVRREVARVALEKLIADGRIHPARIEEMVEKAQREVETMIREEGEAAVLEVGIHGIHPELVKLLGKMKFRTSYGQNALKHSIEVAQLTGLLAAEIGEDVRMAKRAGLLHDIGKAVDHEMEGSHIQLGVELCKKYKESALVINAVESHHGDVEPESLIACLVQAADTISAARPGARRETLETYSNRLQQLEDITNGYKGVEKSFAIQAGREIRIMVVPEQVSDADMVLMARDISKQIESELEYPGQIKVNVIRESRVIDYAK